MQCCVARHLGFCVHDCAVCCSGVASAYTGEHSAEAVVTHIKKLIGPPVTALNDFNSFEAFMTEIHARFQRRPFVVVRPARSFADAMCILHTFLAGVGAGLLPPIYYQSRV